MYPVCLFAQGWCPQTISLSSASPTCTSSGAKSDNPMLPNGLDPVFNFWVYPTQTDSLEDRKRHSSLAAAFSVCFIHCLQSNLTSKKSLPKGKELHLPRECPSGGTDWRRDHLLLFLLKQGHHTGKNTGILEEKKYDSIPMSLKETVSHSLFFLSPVKPNPQKLGLNPKFIFLHVSTQTVKASAVLMSPCS